MDSRSYYQATLGGEAVFAPLAGGHKARVVIIGGGYAGLATALGLTERNCQDVCLLEARDIGHGASGRNGGFVFAGFSLGERALLKALGERDASLAWNATRESMALIARRIRQWSIQCDAVHGDVLWTNWFRDSRVLIERQRLLADHYGAHWPLLNREQLQDHVRSERYSGALREPDAFHVHPLKLAMGFARAASASGARIHAHSEATALECLGEGWRVHTQTGHVDAEHVVLACGGYRSPLYRPVYRSIMPIATYVMATEPLGERLHEVLPSNAGIYDTRFAFDYYRRSVDTRLIWGGRISVRERSPSAVARLLRKDMLKVFPSLADARIEYAWSGLMGYAHHQMPQILSPEPGLWCLQAFGGHGVSTTTLGGELIAQAIAEGGRDWRRYSGFGLRPTWGVAGLIAAQLSYWGYQFLDRMRAVSGR